MNVFFFFLKNCTRHAALHGYIYSSYGEDDFHVKSQPLDVLKFYVQWLVYFIVKIFFPSHTIRGHRRYENKKPFNARHSQLNLVAWQIVPRFITKRTCFCDSLSLCVYVYCFLRPSVHRFRWSVARQQYDNDKRNETHFFPTLMFSLSRTSSSFNRH